MEQLIVIGLIVFFDFAILKWKWEHKRYGDFALDLGMLLVVMNFFHGSGDMLIVGMTAQFLMSLYLLAFPPKFLQDLA